MNINIYSKSTQVLKNGAANLGCTVLEDVLLKDYTTFKVGGIAPLLITPHSIEELSWLLRLFKTLSLSPLILGNGSNVLVTDDGVSVPVIRIADGLTELKLLSETEIYCGAGVKLSALCKFALENELTGLEFAFGIPGSLGGALYMNAGAYGGEMKDVVDTVNHLDRNGNEGSYHGEGLEYGYRTSVYTKNDFIITGAVLSLKKGNPDEIKAKMDELIGKRKDKQPLEYPSAGSTFKRPEGYFAGALIEQCGLKGYTVGGACVSEKHAGFVINKENASAKDILTLIEDVKRIVSENTGVTLEPEVKIIQ